MQIGMELQPGIANPGLQLVFFSVFYRCVLRSREKHGCSPRCTQAGYTSEATTRKASQGCDLSGSSESTHAYGGAGGPTMEVPDCKFGLQFIRCP